jgi:glycosyltransferase involved in cell wall biosynthesis
MNNLHISLTNLKNESRILKETNTLIQNNIFDTIYIVGICDDNLENTQAIDKRREMNRISLKSRKLPKNLFFQLIKYMEYSAVVLTKYKNKDIQVVNIHTLGLLPIGVLYKLFYSTKLIYDAHEYETQTQGLKGIRKKLSMVLEKLLINYCDKTIVVSESISDEYKKLYPNLPRPFVVLNTPSLKKIDKKDIFRDTLGIEKDKTIFLYQGGLSNGRGIEIILDTFKQINDDKSVIVFMGYGPLEELIRGISKEYNNIYFHTAVTPDVLLGFTCSADFGISTIEDTCLSYRYCLPNKMFEYLMAEIPVIVSNLPEMKKLIENSCVGIVTQENTRNGLQEAIKKVTQLDKDELYINIQKVKKIYNWEAQEKVLLKIYKGLYDN